MSDYLKTIYNENLVPRTNYPQLLAKRLIDKYQIKKGNHILEVGCGRGEVLCGFKLFGNNCYGLDQSNAFQKNLEDEGINFIMHKVDKNIKLPFDDETFDIVYTKSFLEHISDPEPLILEFKRILKTGGKMINLVPDWETNFKIYFDDFTHKRPFTKFTLEDLYKVTGFINYKVETFRQLPITWKYKSINFLCYLISLFIHHRVKNKFLKWSRELMIESIAIK
tara:strand:- start:1267 stop:1935 length:669 start_codon:yes stop_codon:yes gene_type:complete